MTDLVINELRSTLAKMEIALGTVDEGIVWTDPNGIVLWCNTAFDQFVEQPHIYILGKFLPAIFPLLSSDLKSPCLIHPVILALNSGKKGMDTYGLVQSNQLLILEISWSYFLEQRANGRAEKGCVLTIRDITERYYTEIELRQSKDLLQRQVIELQQAQARIKETEQVNQELKLFENILDVVLAGYWDWDIANQRSYLSPGLKRMLGYTDNKLRDSPENWQELIFAADLSHLMERFERHVQSRGEQPFYSEVRCHHQNGSTVWVMCSGKVIQWDNNGKPLRAIGCYIDISERKQAEEQLKSSLEDKEVLLKEIHHRVKNNLLVVASLIDWQSEYVHEPSLIKIFDESQKRINTMALIHEKLYGSADLARIDLAEYLETLVRQLFSSSLSNPKDCHIEIEFALESIFLNIETATPCGLIVNELVANSLEHAFPHQRQGKISVQLSQNSQQEITLIVEDNGIGFPPELDFYHNDSLGLQLVGLLTKQLEGKLQISGKNGTRIELTFSELNYQTRI
jgi:PAS domain S-box-containing protein